MYCIVSTTVVALEKIYLSISILCLLANDEMCTQMTTLIQYTIHGFVLLQKYNIMTLYINNVNLNQDR